MCAFQLCGYQQANTADGGDKFFFKIIIYHRSFIGNADNCFLTRVEYCFKTTAYALEAISIATIPNAVYSEIQRGPSIRKY